MKNPTCAKVTETIDLSCPKALEILIQEGVYRSYPFPQNECWLATTNLMPRDIMPSEPRHWMVFGQLVMPVQCCAEAPAAAAVPWLR